MEQKHHFVPQDIFVRDFGGDIINTAWVFRGFLYRNLNEVVRRGYMIPGRGRRQNLIRTDFLDIYFEILSREATAKAEQAHQARVPDQRATGNVQVMVG